MSGRELPPALVALSPGDVRAEHVTQLLASVRAAWSVGVRGFVLREPGLSDRVYLEIARALREIVDRAMGGWLCVHDRAHFALDVGADAVHLGFRSLAPAEVRKWLAPEIALGLSTHADDDASTWGSADYLFHGPLFATPRKEHGLAPIGFEGLRRAVARTNVPMWALGGLKPEHASDVIASKARGMSVLSGILGSEQPGREAARYVAAWNAATIRP